jgi:uncharacterized protein (DUF433 family)
MTIPLPAKAGSSLVMISMALFSQEFICVDALGVAYVNGSTVKVSDLIIDNQINGWSVEEICYVRGDVTPEQVNAAFDYYEAHKADIDPDVRKAEEANRADETLWQHQFATSGDKLTQLAEHARRERLEGKTIPLEDILA